MKNGKRSYKKAAMAILINSRRQILLQLRDNKPEILYPNYWGFIGGSVEEGESEFDGVKREIKEEIGRSITELKYLDKFYLKRHKIIGYVYLGKFNVPENEIHLTEGQCVRYVSLEDITDIKMSKTLKRIVSRNLDEIVEMANKQSVAQQSINQK